MTPYFVSNVVNALRKVSALPLRIGSEEVSVSSPQVSFLTRTSPKRFLKMRGWIRGSAPRPVSGVLQKNHVVAQGSLVSGLGCAGNTEGPL